MNPYVAQHLRVYLLDDHDIVRRGLSDLMSAKRDITVVGDSGSVKHAARQILQLKPDLMVLDVNLQDGTGVEVCREVRSIDPSIRGMLLTASADEEALILSMLAGAEGYVIKLARSIEIIDAVRRLGVGKSMIDQASIERVNGDLLARMKEVRPRLTARQEQILFHLLEGLTDTQIAEQMDITADQASVDVAALIEKVTSAISWMTTISYDRGADRNQAADT